MSSPEQPEKGSPLQLAAEVNDLLNRVGKLKQSAIPIPPQGYSFDSLGGGPEAPLHRLACLHPEDPCTCGAAYSQQDSDLLPSPVEPGFTEPAAERFIDPMSDLMEMRCQLADTYSAGPMTDLHELRQSPDDYIGAGTMPAVNGFAKHSLAGSEARVAVDLLAREILEELAPEVGLGDSLRIADETVHLEDGHIVYLSSRLVDLLSQWNNLPRKVRRG